MNPSRTLIALLLGCGLAGGLASTAAAETTAMPTGPVKLRINWPAGRHGIHTTDITMKSEINSPMSPQPIAQGMDMVQKCSLTVSAGAGGKKELELEYLSVKMGMTMNGQTMVEFDSANPTNGGLAAIAAPLGKLVGAKVRFALDADNHIESVQGTDELQQRLTAGDPAGPLKSLGNPEVLKQQVDFAQYLPNKPVQPGDSWPITLEYPMDGVGTIVMNYNLTLARWEKHAGHWCAKIEMTGSVKSNTADVSAASPVSGMTLNIHDGKCSGESWFDLDMGMIVDCKQNLDMKVDMSMPNPMSKGDGDKEISMTDNVHQAVSTNFELK